MCDIGSRRPCRACAPHRQCQAAPLPTRRRARARRRPTLAGPPPTPLDSRRVLFRGLAADLYAFLAEEHDCALPVFEERWLVGRPGWADAVYLGPRFTVRIGLTIVGAGEASVLTSVRGSVVRAAGDRGWDNNLDSLAFAHGLTAAQWTVPSEARTDLQLRQSMTVQADLTRRLLARVPS